jgi:hypothetical protein
VVEEKLLALWEPWDDIPDASVAVLAAGDRGVATERPATVPLSVDRAGLAIETDRGAGAKGDGGAARSSRSSSGGTRLRSAPLS